MGHSDMGIDLACFSRGTAALMHASASQARCAVAVSSRLDLALLQCQGIVDTARFNLDRQLLRRASHAVAGAVYSVSMEAVICYTHVCTRRHARGYSSVYAVDTASAGVSSECVHKTVPPGTTRHCPCTGVFLELRLRAQAPGLPHQACASIDGSMLSEPALLKLDAH